MKKVLLIIILCCMFYLLLHATIGAVMNVENWETERIELTDQEIEDRCKFLSISKAKIINHEDNYVFSFDVDESERCVILLDDATIHIINEDADITDTFAFNERILQTKVRDAAVRWNNGNIELLVGDEGYLIDLGGNIIDAWSFVGETSFIPNPDIVHTEKYTYELKNSVKIAEILGRGDRDLFIRTDKIGNETVLFESDNSMPIGIIVFLVLLVAFPTVTAVFIIGSIKYGRQGT